MRHDSAKSSHTSRYSVNPERMVTQSIPPNLTPKTAQRTSLGHRILGALTGGPDRKFSAHHSPPGGAASPSLLTDRRFAFPILALLAVLAFGLLFLLPGGPLHAQDADGPIMYPEDETIPVATYTATDPERRPVYWSLANADNVSAIDDIETADNADVAHFSISASGVLSFNFPPDYEAPPSSNATGNTYKVVVIAADEPLGAANRELGSKKVTVNVTNVDEPGVITLDAQQPQENRALTATLIDDDASDAQKMAAKWKWEHSESTGGPWTAILTATSAAYTPLGVADKYLRATATYTDEHGSDKTAQVVSAHMVRAVPAANNAAPVFPDEDTGTQDIQVGRKVDENSPPGTNVGDPVVANDAPGDVLTYTFSGGANDSSYSIDPATGQITVGPRIALDREAIGGFTHTVNVTATDPAGGDTEQEVTITINDVNEDPVITDGDTKASVVENTAIATPVSTYTADPEVSGTACADTACTWSLKGADAGDFNIGNQTGGTPGQLTFKEAPNFEMPADANGDNVYMVTVVVTDAGIEGKGKLSAERDVVVTVTNINEGMADTVVTLSSLQPKVGIPLTATLDDPDGGEKDIEWQWSITGASTTNVPGTLTATTDGEISGAESATYTPKINDVEGTLTATVMYADAVGSDQTGTARAANAVVQDLAAKAPVFDPKPTSRSVKENYVSTDTDHPNVGAPVTATDPNDDTMTYSLGGTDAGSFSINQVTGQITVKTATKLDRETKPTYMVTVTATDPGGLSDSVDVTIMVTEVDEAPVIMKGALTNQAPAFPSATAARDVAENTEADQPIGAPVTASDINGDTLEYSLGGADAASFAIDAASGQIMTRAALNYETKQTYSVTVTAQDLEDLEDTIMVTITVTNEDEDGTVTLSSERPKVGTAITATLTDPDGGVTGTTWRWERSPDEATWTTITGETSMSYTPVDVDEDMYLRATASYTDAEGSRKSMSMVSANAVSTTPTTGNEVADRYDSNENGEIEKDEVFDAIDAYFATDTLTKENVLDIIDLYLGL